MATLLPNRLFRLAPLPQLQVTSRRLLRPSQLGCASISVDPRLDMTFKVDCTLLVFSLKFPTLFCGGTCPGVPQSHQAREPCNWTLAERWYLPSSVHRGIPVVLQRECCSHCSFLIRTIACLLRATALIVTLVLQCLEVGRSIVIAPRLTSPNRSRLFGLGTA